ncbi:hypothetical protein [Aeromicrobium sp. Root236]|uniref:hypothetical protein n=1 Tax=Aeromicrobium sp. Root236 TaxID=1736498 RepID=UPI001F43D7B3|nr:hypothetical protein [Aeromicrobium sp. Root236]
MLPAVVLDEHLPTSVDKVAARQEMTELIEDVDVELRLGKATFYEGKPHVGLARRLDSFADAFRGAAGPLHAVKMRRHRVRPQSERIRVLLGNEPIPYSHELRDREQGAAVDKRTFWTEEWHAPNERGTELALKTMQDEVIAEPPDWLRSGEVQRIHRSYLKAPPSKIADVAEGGIVGQSAQSRLHHRIE